MSTSADIHMDIYNKRLADKANKQAFHDMEHKVKAMVDTIVILSQQLKAAETAVADVYQASLNNLCELTEPLIKNSNDIDVQAKFDEFCS